MTKRPLCHAAYATRQRTTGLKWCRSALYSVLPYYRTCSIKLNAYIALERDQRSRLIGDRSSRPISSWISLHPDHFKRIAKRQSSIFRIATLAIVDSDQRCRSLRRWVVVKTCTGFAGSTSTLEDLPSTSVGTKLKSISVCITLRFCVSEIRPPRLVFRARAI